MQLSMYCCCCCAIDGSCADDIVLLMTLLWAALLCSAPVPLLVAVSMIACQLQTMDGWVGA